MPGKNTPVQTSAQSQTFPVSPLAIERTTDAVNIAKFGMDAVEDLRAILQAIYKLSGHDELITGLARVGVTLADDRHNMLDCERETMVDKLVALREADHA